MNTDARHLVFGDDGSAAADVVWQWIANHSWPQWRISVVTAQQPPVGPTVSSERATPHPWSPPTPRRLPETADGTPVEHLLAEADPRLVLDSFKDVSLMTIGPRGAGVLKHLHIGSTAEWLVSGGRPLAPLAIVRSAHPTRKVLVCIDGSAHAHAAAAAVADLPWLGDTHVTILGVTSGEDEVERGVEDAARLLGEHHVAIADKQLIPAIPRSAFDVRPTILDVIAEDAPDLVVMGNRGAGGFRQTILGSTTSAVLRHVDCSVLVARQPDDGQDPA